MPPPPQDNTNKIITGSYVGGGSGTITVSADFTAYNPPTDFEVTSISPKIITLPITPKNLFLFYTNDNGDIVTKIIDQGYRNSAKAIMTIGYSGNSSYSSAEADNKNEVYSTWLNQNKLYLISSHIENFTGEDDSNYYCKSVTLQAIGSTKVVPFSPYNISNVKYYYIAC